MQAFLTHKSKPKAATSLSIYLIFAMKDPFVQRGDQSKVFYWSTKVQMC